MERFKDNVPFDPGYTVISFSFIENISYLTQDYETSKAPHQRKFKLSQLEPKILELIIKSTAFYLGCMLWGGFIHCKFKNEPKEITGNHTQKLSEEEKKALNCAEETEFTLKYIEKFDRDLKYFLKKSANLPAILNKILKSYKEFAELNQNFVNISKTSDIKLPKVLEHFKDLTDGQLDELYSKIMEAIDSRKIEKLLEVGFFEKN